MGLFGRGKQPAAGRGDAAVFTADREATIDQLVEASDLMDRWDQALGNSSAVWGCMSANGRAGRAPSMQAAMDESYRTGVSATIVVDRPWRWWASIGQLALDAGQPILAGRVFMFMFMFIEQLAPSMSAFDQGDVGLSTPLKETQRRIALQAAQAFNQLDPDYLIHDTATGKVPVRGASEFAQTVLSRTT